MYGFKIGPGLETLQAGVKYIIVEENKIEQLKNTIKFQETTIECQGREASRRHELLCEVKEVLDKYFKEDN